MEGSVFIGNRSSLYGSAVHVDVRSSFSITNCTFDGNETSYNSGAAITTRAESRVEIINTLITNTINGRSVFPVEQTPTDISYSDFYGNEHGDWIEDLADQENVFGNFSADPLYVDSNNDNYFLSEGSPCIDAGSPDVNPDPDGTPSDIGAYYFHQASNVNEDISTLYPSGITITGNYPNPFNSQTTLIYTVGASSPVDMVIYDVLGRVVDKTSLGYRRAGRHVVTWNAENVPSGSYFLSLKSEKNQSVIKVDFLK